MSARRRHRAGHAEHKNEPLILWWMPVLAILAPLLSAAWSGATSQGQAFSDALFALIWPGLPLYFAVIAVLWAGWKIELE